MAFCRKCGNRLTEGQKFCTRCGEPVQIHAVQQENPAQQPYTAPPRNPAPPEPPAKKSGGFLTSTGGKILIITASALLTAGLVFGGVMAARYGLKLREEKIQESLAKLQTEDTDREESEVSTTSAQPESTEPSGTEAEESSTTETERPTETEPETETETEPETVDLASLSDDEVLDRYKKFLEEKLIPEKGIFNPLQVNYGIGADGSVYRYEHSWNPKSGEIETKQTYEEYRDRDYSVYNKEGIVSAFIWDFTGDGIKELLVICGEQGISWDGAFTAELYGLTQDSAEFLYSKTLEIPGLDAGRYDSPVTEISVVLTETGEPGLMLYHVRKHSDVSMTHEACVLAPGEDFSVRQHLKAHLLYDSGMPTGIEVTVIGEDLSEQGSSTYEIELGGDLLDVQGHRAVYSFGGYETLISLLEDRMDGVTDNSSFLEAYFMKPKEEDFSDSEIVIGRDALLYSEEDRYEGMDAEISIDTVRFNRKDGEYSAILNKINAVIAQYTEGNYEYGRSEPGVLYYQYEIGDVIIAKDYISVSGYLTGYVAGGAHGWGSARSWVFSLETGDPMDLRYFTGLSEQEIQERISLYYKDSGETQKAAYEAFGLDYTSDVTEWADSESAEAGQYFRNFCLLSDGWFYLENIAYLPASGGNSFSSRIGQPEEFRLFTGDPNGRAIAAEESSAEESTEPEESTSSELETYEKANEGLYLDSGVPVSDEKIEHRLQHSDYLWANVDSETGQILYGGYLFEVAGIDDLYYSDTYCFDGEHFTYPILYTEIDWNDPPGAYFTASNAKEIADSVFTDDMRTWADALSSGGRFLVIWNSPYGICAYTHTRDEYADGPDGLGYMLNEDAILDMCRSIGLDRALIPESSREN